VTPKAVVVDTDVVSFIFKGDSRGDSYRPYLEDRRLLVSFQTVAELWLWAEIQDWGERRRGQLAKYLDSFTCVHSNLALCQQWSEAMGEARRLGKPILSADAWNAAIALALKIPLVTHNRADYQGVQGLMLLSNSGIDL
jgi:tRNA(fMet)-specific endonuclease VapC